MYGQALQQTPWQRLRATTQRGAFREKSRSVSPQTGGFTRAVRALLTFAGCVLYTGFSLVMAGVATAILIMAPVLVFFGALAGIGLFLHIVSLIAQGVGLA